MSLILLIKANTTHMELREIKLVLRLLTSINTLKQLRKKKSIQKNSKKPVMMLRLLEILSLTPKSHPLKSRPSPKTHSLNPQRRLVS